MFNYKINYNKDKGNTQNLSLPNYFPIFYYYDLEIMYVMVEIPII